MSHAGSITITIGDGIPGHVTFQLNLDNGDVLYGGLGPQKPGSPYSTAQYDLYYQSSGEGLPDSFYGSYANALGSHYNNSESYTFDIDQNGMEAALAQIGAHESYYDNYNAFNGNVCTTFADGVLDAAGIHVPATMLPSELKDYLRDHYTPDYAGPGSGSNTPREGYKSRVTPQSPGYTGPDTGDDSPHERNPLFRRHHGVPLNPRDPLVLDLNDDGVHLTSLNYTNTYFDYLGTGVATKTAWITPGDGILLKKGSQSDHLVGDDIVGFRSGAGFEDLAQLDANHDGKIDINDPAYAELSVWVDANNDAKLDLGELKSLADLQISAISTNSTLVNQDDNGSQIVATASFSSSGLYAPTRGVIGEVNFATDRIVNTYVPPEGFVYSDDVLKLPLLAGYGSVPDLQTAMMLHPQLLADVKALVLGASTMSEQQFDAAFTGIVEEWIGVANLDPSAQGAYCNARHLGVGYAFYGINPSTDPTFNIHPTARTGPQWEAIYSDIMSGLRSRFVSQLTASALMNGLNWTSATTCWYSPFSGIAYDFPSDSIDLNIDGAVDAIVRNAPAADAQTNGANLDAYYGRTLALLKDAGQEGFDEDWTSLKANFVRASEQAGMPVRFEHDFLDSVNPAAVDDEDGVTGQVSSLNDSVLFLGSGNKDVVGHSDVVYVYRAADGTDIIRPDNRGSVLVLPDLSSDDLTFLRPNGGHDLVIVNKATGQSITVVDEFWTGGLKSILLADTTLSLPYGAEAFLQDQASRYVLDSVKNGVSIGDQAAVLATYGFLSVQDQDGLTGTQGATARDGVVFLGSGSKTISASNGYDVYVYAAATGGSDTIDVNGNYGTNTLVLSDLQPDQVSFGRARDWTDDLVITIPSTGQTITLRSQFDVGADIQTRLLFADGTVVTPAQIRETLLKQQESQPGADIVGFESDDILGAGTGDRRITGGGGHDVYVYGHDGGNVTIDNNSNNASDNQVLRFSDLTSTDVVVGRNGLSKDLTFTVSSTGKVVTVLNQFSPFDPAYSGPIALFEYSDGVTWTKDQLRQKLLDQDTAATSGGVYGYSSDDRIVAGTGDKYLAGDGGADTYVYSRASGNDTIYAFTQNVYERAGIDKLVLNDLMPADVTLSQPNGGSDIVLSVTGGGSLTFTNFFSSKFGATSTISTQNPDGTYSTVEKTTTFTFADGTVWDLDAIKHRLLADEAAAGSGGVYGFDGDDTIVAGPGDKVLSGGRGNDTYLYTAATGGNDLVADGGTWNSANDQLILTDLNPGDVTFARDPSDPANVVVNITATGKFITLSQGYQGSSGIETIAFQNGTVLTVANIDLGPIVGTDNDDYLYGSSRSDTFQGKAGNDFESGGAGSDVYLYSQGDGADRIGDTAGQPNTDVDVLKLTDILSQDVTLAADDSGNLLVTVPGSAAPITVYGQFAYDLSISPYADPTDGIEQIVFADGATWDHAEILRRAGIIAGTDGDDQLVGGAGDDRIIARSGNDVAYGGTGNDRIFLGDGDDYADGGAGDDVIDGGAGTDEASYASASAGVTVDLSKTGWQDTGGAGSDLITGFENLTGSAYADRLRGDAGPNVLRGLGGADRFTFMDTFGADVVADFTVGEDILEFGSLTFADAAAVRAAASQNGTDVVIDAGTQGSVTLRNLSLADLDNAQIDIVHQAAHKPPIVKPQGTDNISFDSAVDLAGAFDLFDDPDVTASTTVPHATVLATASGDGREFYKVQVDAPGRAIFDIDHGDFDSVVELFDANETSIASNDDDYSDPGSSPFNSYIDYYFGQAGTYYLAVGRYGSDGIPTVGSTYTLNVSTEYPTSPPAGGTLDGTEGDDELNGTSGADVIRGLGGNDRLLGGAGNDDLIGGAGSDIYVFGPASGQDTIEDFQATGTDHDLIEFDHAVFADASSALAASSQVGNDVLITASQADTILLRNTQLASLSDANIRIT